MKKKLVSLLIYLLLTFSWVPLYIWGPEQEQMEHTEVIEEEWDLIRWKQEDMHDSSLEVFEHEEIQGMD